MRFVVGNDFQKTVTPKESSLTHARKFARLPLFAKFAIVELILKIG